MFIMPTGYLIALVNFPTSIMFSVLSSNFGSKVAVLRTAVLVRNLIFFISIQKLQLLAFSEEFFFLRMNICHKIQ